MPWVNVISGRELTGEERTELKSGFALVLEQLLDKKETGLTVTFLSAAGLYRGGVESPDGAVIEVRYIGQYPAAKKQEITRCFVGLLARAAGFDPSKIIVPFAEFLPENYGRQTAP